MKKREGRRVPIHDLFSWQGFQGKQRGPTLCGIEPL
jgi:hypothetical protein